jgi:hypothetical protein
LDEIKSEYLKLEQAYFDKAKECEQVKLEVFEGLSQEVEQL